MHKAPPKFKESKKVRRHAANTSYSVNQYEKATERLDDCPGYPFAVKADIKIVTSTK